MCIRDSVEPAFATGTSETSNEANEETSNEASNEPSDEVGLATSTAGVPDELDEEPVDSSSSVAFPNRQRVIQLAALAATLLICSFLGSMWWFGGDPDVVGSQNPNVDTTNIERPQAIADQPSGLEDGLEGDPPDFLASGNRDAYHSDEDLAHEIARQSNEEDLELDPNSEIDPLTALIEEIARANTDSNSSPNLVDAPKLVDTETDLHKIGTAEDLDDQPELVANPDGPTWDLKPDWNLAIQFAPNGLGAVSLNGEPVQAIFLQDNAVYLLRQIADEFQRRVQYLDNRLGSQVNGSIEVGQSNFRFEHVSKLDETIDKIDEHINELNIRPLKVNELMDLRVRYRKGIFANRDKFGTIDLANKDLRFYTEDEAFAICSVLSSSEAMLRDLANKRLVWEESTDTSPSEPKLVNRIAPSAFEAFAEFGKLSLPDPVFSDQSIASIQKLGPSELMRMLQGTSSVELFRDFNEFQEAKDFVYSNGPPEMKLRLKIDKIDRRLEEYADSKSEMTEMTEFVVNGLTAEKGRLTSQLRRSAVTLPGDSVAVQPLQDVLAERTDLQGLPLAMGKECHSDATETSDLKSVASSLGRMVNRFNGSLGSRDNAQNDAFRNLSIKQMVSYCMEEHLRDRMGDRTGDPSAQKLKTVDQILQIDHPRLRMDFIDALRGSESETATKLMVNKAKFDLVPQVRMAATEALADIDPGEYREDFLEGFKYPWHVVAEHSAEALVRLNDQGSIPKLIEMLDLPHPHLPIQLNGELVQCELVRINHMRNCLLCHAPSICDNDSTRGLIPHLSRPLPSEYYESRGEPAAYAVRADITYLEQDFSVVQPVQDPGPWPREQRFDYVVRKKRLTPAEASNLALQINQSPNRYRNAIIYALRELTGETPDDNSSSSWKKIMSDR